MPTQTTTTPRPWYFAWSDLVVARGPDLAVRVRARGATKQELVDVQNRVEPAGRTLAPRVPDPPGGFEVVGSVDGGVAAAANLDVATFALRHAADPYGAGPGNPVVHRLSWSKDGAVGLIVLTLPSRLASLDALPGLVGLDTTGWETRTSRIKVRGRPGVVVEDFVLDSPLPGPAHRSLYTQTPWGNLLIIVAFGDPVPSINELTAMAASVERTSAEGWSTRIVRHGDPSG